MKATDVEHASSAPVSKPNQGTVELVGFRPTLATEGPDTPSLADAAAYLQRLKARRKMLCWAIVLVVVTIAVGPKIYRQAKTDRASFLARAAAADFQKGHTDEAIATVRSAYLMAPSDPEVLRAMAQILSGLNAPSAMTYWNWVLSSPIATEADRREAAESALKLGYYNHAGAIIKDLLHRDDHSAPNLLMAARYYSVGGAPGLAMGFATKSVQSDPSYKPAAVFLAIQELNNAGLFQTGVDSLLKIAQGSDAYGFLAIERLAQIPNLTPAQNQAALDDLRPYGGPTEARQLVELILRLKLEPAQRDKLIGDAVSRQTGSSVEDLVQFGNWLNANGESKRIFALIPREKISTNKELFIIYLDAVGAEKRWDDMDTLLNQRPLPLETAYAELYLFRCSEELGDTESADLHWRGAVIAASHSPRESLYIADYATKMGETARAEPIYRSLTHDLMGGRPAYLGLIHIYQSTDTVKLRDVLDEMTGRWSDDEAVENDDIYYNLLLKTRSREMYNRAVKLSQADVYSAPHLTDVALGDLRLNQPEQALQVFESAHIEWDTASSPTRIVYAAALKANGRDAEASLELSTLDRKALRPEEQALIGNIR